MSGPRKLVDVLKQTSPEYLKKGTTQVRRAMREILGEELQTRFMRNHFLVDPKSLQLMVDHDKLNLYRTFAVFKPAFCPMRRAQADENYHRVSVESFVGAAMKSTELVPMIKKIGEEDAALAASGPAELLAQKGSSPQPADAAAAASSSLKIRVLNDLSLMYSGPILIALQTGPGRPTSLRRGAVHYDVLIFGHDFKVQQTEDSVEPHFLFPDIKKETLDAAKVHAEFPLRCTAKVDRIGYYAMHPVTLLRVSIFHPIVATAPDLVHYVTNHRNTFVVGDAAATEGENGDQQPQHRRFNYGNALRGDFDLPRLFVHSRSVTVDVDVLNPQQQIVGVKSVEFQCRNCFEPLVNPEKSMMIKKNKIQLVDGSWSKSMY
uniref:Uncharacterized protein n=1 Tax=Bodo saltans TaxID=75058 RepID=B6DT77_BODSA|nr:hypothetical protein [Bodo saltans]